MTATAVHYDPKRTLTSFKLDDLLSKFNISEQVNNQPAEGSGPMTPGAQGIETGLNRKSIAPDLVLDQWRSISAPPIVKFQKEQVYDGVIVEVNPTTRIFTARLVDRTADNLDEMGEFSLDELNGDEDLAVPGALFTWIIGLATRGALVKRISDLRIRRFAPFSKESIIKAEANAAIFADRLAQYATDVPFR